MKNTVKKVGLAVFAIVLVVVISFFGGIVGSQYAKSAQADNSIKATVGFSGQLVGEHYTYDMYSLEDFNAIEGTRIGDVREFEVYLADNGYTIEEVPQGVAMIVNVEGVENQIAYDEESAEEFNRMVWSSTESVDYVTGVKDLGCVRDVSLSREYCVRKVVTYTSDGVPSVTSIEYREYEA